MIPPAPAIVPPWLPCTAPLPPEARREVPVPLVRKRAPRVSPVQIIALDDNTRVRHYLDHTAWVWRHDVGQAWVVFP